MIQRAANGVSAQVRQVVGELDQLRTASLSTAGWAARNPISTVAIRSGSTRVMTSMGHGQSKYKPGSKSFGSARPNRRTIPRSPGPILAMNDDLGEKIYAVSGNHLWRINNTITVGPPDDLGVIGTPASNYPITIAATSNGIQHTVTVDFHIDQSPQ